MKVYTLKGFEKNYETYGEAQAERNRLGRTKEIPIGFESADEAEAYRTGRWEEYFGNTYKRFVTDADAVVYADGSYDEKTGNGAYGIVIFFKDGGMFSESALLEDVEPEIYKVTRYGMDGKQDGEPVFRTYVDIFKGKEVEDKKHSFVRASRQDGGECESVMRALEICCKDKGLKKIKVAYDCELIKTRFGNGREGASSNVPYAYGVFCDELVKEYGVQVDFIKVDSHTDKKGKGQYLVGSETYPHAVYNDIVDTLAKAEMQDNPIKYAENSNMARVMPDEFKTFKEVEALALPGQKQQARRMHARNILVVTVEKKLGPVFME